VHADTAVIGASDASVIFRVPNEEDSATVTKLAVQLPTDHPLLGVLVRPHPDWTTTVKQVKLNPPVSTDDGPVTEAVSEITWTASAAAAILAGAGGYRVGPAWGAGSRSTRSGTTRLKPMIM
jgi:uncharacterized protein YcnI